MNDTSKNSGFHGVFSPMFSPTFSPDTLRAPLRVFTAFLIVSLYAAAVVGCGAKTIDRKPMQETPAEDAGESAADGQDGEAVTYPGYAAGTVTELYGESGEAEQSQAYRDAVEENPALRYIIVYFDFNRVDIKPESREVLTEHAEYLSEHPEVEVSLEGHADKRGSSGYNLALGERRSLAVKNFLRARGVREFQTSVVSYGEERPAVEGNSEEAYAKNRRVELVYR